MLANFTSIPSVGFICLSICLYVPVFLSILSMRLKEMQLLEKFSSWQWFPSTPSEMIPQAEYAK
jgi:hypothetical protein